MIHNSGEETYRRQAHRLERVPGFRIHARVILEQLLDPSGQRLTPMFRFRGTQGEKANDADRYARHERNPDSLSVEHSTRRAILNRWHTEHLTRRQRSNENKSDLDLAPWP